jgi:hypothetical protein
MAETVGPFFPSVRVFIELPFTAILKMSKFQLGFPFDARTALDDWRLGAATRWTLTHNPF